MGSAIRRFEYPRPFGLKRMFRRNGVRSAHVRAAPYYHNKTY